MIKNRCEKHEAAAMPDAGPCLQQHKVRSLIRTVLELSTCSEFCSSLFAHGQGSPFITKMAGNCLKCPTPPFRAVRAILSLVTWIKIDGERLNEKQITVASVLPSIEGNTGIQGLASATREAWALLSLAGLQL